MSYSRLRYHAECPHKFRLAYLDGHREVSSDRFTGEGSRFHEHCETLAMADGTITEEHDDDQPSPEELGAHCQRFNLEMDPGSVPDLVQRFGIRFPAEPLIRP